MSAVFYLTMAISRRTRARDNHAAGSFLEVTFAGWLRIALSWTKLTAVSVVVLNGATKRLPIKLKDLDQILGKKLNLSSEILT